jgi:integrase
MADAMHDNLIARNPAAGLKLPRTTRKRPLYLTHEQVTALATASGEYEGLVLLLSYTGLRWGEAIGLRVRDLDMLRHRATISENAVQAGRQIHVGTPKTHKQRSVPLPGFLLPYLPASAKAAAATNCCSATAIDIFAALTQPRGGLPRP